MGFDDIHGYLRQIIGSGPAMRSEMMLVIMQTHQAQTWFQKHQGMAMARRVCGACCRDRVFTIWCDGTYQCLFCLYRQAWKGEEGPIRLDVTQAAMRDFTQLWLSFRRHAHGIDEGWMLMEETPIAGLWRPPTPLCQADDCEACASCRPHVAGPNGKRCFQCLMKQGLKAVPATQPKRPTRERLDEVARLAAESMYVSV